jgi:pimeloyl-ACP methyl ester carboxylesterase
MQFFTWPIVQVIKLLNLKKLLIVGHSYGGLITAHLTPLVKERVLGVWLVCPAGFNKRLFSESEKKELYESFGNQFKVGPDLMEFISYLTFDKVSFIFSSFSKIKLFYLIDFLKNYKIHKFLSAPFLFSKISLKGVHPNKRL